MAIPALLSKKANAPVMMRISREEEHYIGRARPGVHARVKIGFRKDGRIPAIDMYASATTVRTTRRATAAPPADHLAVLSAEWRCGGAALNGADQHAAARPRSARRAACRASG